MNPLALRHLAPQTWLQLSIILTLLPHAAHLPAWLSGLCVMLLAWQGWRLRQDKPQTKAQRRTLLTVIALVGVGSGIALKIHFGTFFGKDPGIAFLAVLLCLKQVESQSTRDIRAAIWLSYFLQLGLFLYFQTIPVALLALLSLWVSTTTLLSLEDSEASAMQQFRQAGSLAFQALPLLLILFITFPRVQGPLWGLPADAFSASTGLSNEMSPGDISDLSLSSAIAFRAQFDGPVPPPELRYWRGPVLSNFDGYVWRPLRFADTPAKSPFYTPSGPRYDYQLTLEPHNRHWMLALDFPGSDIPQALYGREYQLYSEQPIRSRSRFNVSAYPQSVVGVDAAPELLRANLRLPEDANPRTRAQIADLITDNDNPTERVRKVLEFMRASPLIYTLRPPRLGPNSIDEFLFDTRQGFCEHFSAAFVFMMRAANVPARVVTGYLGGEINPFDGTLVVRQSDAHAWAEVWLDGRGWVRIDPTTLAAPQRLELGLAQAMPDVSVLPWMLRPELSWLRELRHRWEAVSYAWNDWVLGYTPERQRELLSRLGLSNPDWSRIAAVMIACVMAIALILLAWTLKQRPRHDALQQLWLTFCQRLQRRGVTHLVHEGPLDFAARAAKLLPAHADAIHAIAHEYAALRYGSTDSPPAARLQALKNQIKRFRPQ